MQPTVITAKKNDTLDGAPPAALTHPVEFQLAELRGRLARLVERGVKEYKRGGHVDESTLAAIVVATTELTAFERVRAIALLVEESAPTPAVAS